jgi:hypothetical protein
VHSIHEALLLLNLGCGEFEGEQAAGGREPAEELSAAGGEMDDEGCSSKGNACRLELECCDCSVLMTS